MNTFTPGQFQPERVALPEINLSNAADADDIVIGVIGKPDQFYLLGQTKELDRDAGRHNSLLSILNNNGLTSDFGALTVVTLPSTRVIAVGLGENADLTCEQLRQAAGIAARFVASGKYHEPRRLVFNFEVTAPAQIQAVAEGALLGCYSFNKLGKNTEPQVSSITILGSGRQSEMAVETARQTSYAVAVARDLTNLPPNLLSPEEFCAQATGYLKDTKVQVSVLDEKALQKQGFGGILAVGGGSSRPPRLFRAEYSPRGAKKTLVLIGKGITFDSGGYNLKPGSSMITMKNDMSGAADVIAAIGAIARLGLKIHVIAYAALAESLVSGTAYRPSDVLTMYNGTTVENRNCDAEGRIVLADALARSAEDSPDLIVDVATLTGACVSALGNKTGGLFANSDEVADLVLDAAESAGEPFWQLPITDDIRSNLSSAVADIQSSGPREGGLVFSAAFLEEFVPEGKAWAHLDIAGPAWSDSAEGYISKEATGMSVRTLIALAHQLA